MEKHLEVVELVLLCWLGGRKALVESRGRRDAVDR